MGSVGAKPFILKNEIFRENREGFTFGKTSLGDLFLGYGPNDSQFAKDTPENRARLNSLWETYSFSREIKRRR